MSLITKDRIMSPASRMAAADSDASSELSDAPSLAYDGDNSGDEPCSPTSYGFPTTPATPTFLDHVLPTQSGRKRKAFPESRYRFDSSESESAEDEQLHASYYKKKRRVVVKNAPFASIETLPNEVIQRIAVNLTSDADLHNFSLASPTIPQNILPENSEIWRYRFLALYDYPRIRDAYDFCLAYKLRRFVLRTFDDMGHGFNLRHVIQLEVLRDIILESYSTRKSHLPATEASRNIRVLTSPTLSPWIKALLSCPFPGSELKRFGIPSKLFETIQLTLSHLVLSPRSALAHVIETSRSNYNMVKVYNFHRSFATLYTRRSIEEPTTVRRQSRLFPKLNSPSPNLPTVMFELDTNALLHIKNFWHRHLIDDSEPAGEHTYAAMTRGLSKLGHTPQEWKHPLEDDVAINGVWHGHYSAIYPWPESEKQLMERQTTADDWQNVDPMKLNFVTTNDYAEGFWPPALSSFVAFQNTVPQPSEKDYHRLFENDGQRHKTKAKDFSMSAASVKQGPVYIRGIASFLDMPMVRRGEINPNSQVGPSTSANLPTQPVDKAQRYHPFVALRIRGVIHDIPASATTSVEDLPGGRKRGNHAIPGWKRIVMVMYKPNVRYLLQVLEFATEEFGGTFGTQVTNSLNIDNTMAFPGVQTTVPVAIAAMNGVTTLPTQSANAVNTTTVLSQSLTTNQPGQVLPQAIAPSTIATAASLPTTSIQQSQLQAQPQPQFQTQPLPPTPTTSINPIALHNQLTDILHSKLKAYTSAYPPNSPIPLFSPEHLINLENAFSPPHALDWSDGSIDHAYAYEGVIVPGGRIMMGRWWRCHGSFGAGEGKEIDTLGVGVEIDEEDDAGEDEHRSDGDEADDEGEDEEGDALAASSRRTRPLERGPFVFWS